MLEHVQSLVPQEQGIQILMSKARTLICPNAGQVVFKNHLFSTSPQWDVAVAGRLEGQGGLRYSQCRLMIGI